MSPRRIAKALAGFGAIAVVTLLAVTVWVVHSRSIAEGLEKIAAIAPDSLLHAHNFHWTQMKNGQRQWVLTARDASYGADKKSVLLTDAAITMTASDGKPVKIEAPHAVLALNANHVTRADMSGGTVVHYGDFVITTDSAAFMPDGDKVEAPGFVTLTGAGIKMTGIGLTGQPKERTFQLLRQVTTEVQPKHDNETSKPG
ncbi:MAG: LPS export ABC transporter periplasmic protein LptC [Candidatus Binataceae bacterium]